MPELASRKLDASHYRTRVSRSGDSIFVIFLDKNAFPSGRGNRGSRPGLEVELDAGSLKVIRSYFIR